MNKFNIKLGAAVAMATFVASVLAPASLADTVVTVNGNGANSTNNVTVNNTCNTTVNQTNVTDVNTTVNASSHTGGNTANNNTGGDVNITTGDANTTVNVSVGGSSNTANTTDCCCQTNTTTALVDVSGNGTDSFNQVHVKNKTTRTTWQTNVFGVNTGIKSKSKTGWNGANGNTGGSTGVNTGDASSHVTVNVTGPSNSL